MLINPLAIACLVVHKNKQAIVGRHATSDLVLTEDTISNRHCKLFTNTSGFVLCEDMSTNGTYWNGNLIGKGESVILSHGDSIRIRTSHHFIFQDFLKATTRHIDPEIGTIEKMYQILPQTLGKGTFAKVNLAIHRKTKVQLAVKIMDRIRYSKPENSGGTDVEKEVAILRIVDHPNIVPVVDVIKTTRFIYIFLQMLSGGDLFEYIVSRGPLPEFEAKFVVYQTLQALKHLHNMNISHRDLKPENLMLTSATKYPRVLLTDFGMAREFAQEHLMNTMCGTFAYMAPEVFDAKHAGGPGYGSTADCWSLGVMIYVILSGTHPFTTNYSNENEASMRQKMRSRNLSFPPWYWKGISIEARSLIRCLLILNPEERWSVDDALKSEWIQKDVAWLRQRYRETVWGHWIKSSQRLHNVLQHTTTTTNTPENKPNKREQTDSWGRLGTLAGQ
ncbi:hypothetical protein BGZ50_001464 [Haplosporangium sp. Z 11]|nr:hypothetical protein BGZ50_001464 [Haplosporangium sp. Z 11]